MKSDDLARSALQDMGYDVLPIPPSVVPGKKEADFLVSYHEYSALIEAKLKESDPDEDAKREAALNSGVAYCSHHARGRNETISAIIGHGNRQLESSADKKHDFRMLFFVADCAAAKVVVEKFIDTIYGSTDVLDVAATGSIKKCYFYRNSDFYRRKTIDAAIVGHLSDQHLQLKICLNPYSENYISLKNSNFLYPFGSSVLDPNEEEKLGRAFIPDSNIERKELEFSKHFPLYDPVLIHLAQKYHTGQLIKMDFNSPEISIRYTNKNAS